MILIINITIFVLARKKTIMKIEEKLLMFLKDTV